VNLSIRESIPELMDATSIGIEEHRQALDGLARINRWTGSAKIFQPSLRKIYQSLNRPLRVLDVATGSGDIPVSLAKWSNDSAFSIEWAGCDLRGTAIDLAKQRARSAHVPVTFFVHDSLNEPLPTGYDVVITSLFLHHLSRKDVITLVSEMARVASHAVIISDLSRSRFNYSCVWLASHLLSRSPIVHFDGPASVQSAWTPAEIIAIAHESGLKKVSVESRFPCRWLMTWIKPQ
jgi:2-polyprenyl-3-methyl-5-hydroxy-6-metoxy-1,4-benzoquinol methylase